MREFISLVNRVFSLFFFTVFFFVTIEAIYSVCWQLHSSFSGEESSAFDLYGLGFLFVIIVMTILLKRVLKNIFCYFLSLMSKGSNRQWLLAVLGLGLTLRLTYLFFYPANPSSDGAVYLSLAGKIIAGEPYMTGGYFAYWPPGYPLFMVPWLTIFPVKLAVILSNSTLFLCTSVCLFIAIRDVAGAVMARGIGLLLVCWPNLIAFFATPEKESLVIAIFSIVILILVKFQTELRGIYSLLIGFLIGYASLVQPSFLLFCFAIPFSMIVARCSIKAVVPSTFFVMLGMAVIIAPWTFRNYLVFNKVVLITSNGGSNFYRANNPIADGRYQPRGVLDFDSLGELTASSAAYSAAIEWIKEEPGKFLCLCLKKQLIFLGDDSTGFYNTMKRGSIEYSRDEYYFAKAISNIFWLGLWILLMISNSRKSWRAMSILEIFSRLGILYLWGLHSFFESASKYHIPASVFILVLVACQAFRMLKIWSMQDGVEGSI